VSRQEVDIDSWLMEEPEDGDFGDDFYRRNPDIVEVLRGMGVDPAVLS
jgi:hypothetical protein